VSVTGNINVYYFILHILLARITRFGSTTKGVGCAKGNIYELISHRDNGFRALHFLWETGQVRAIAID